MKKLTKLESDIMCNSCEMQGLIQAFYNNILMDYTFFNLRKSHIKKDEINRSTAKGGKTSVF